MEKENQIVNLSQIDQISSGDPKFRNEMIGIFVKQIPQFIENIQNFWGSNDLENLAKEVHTAKSSVLIFGMENTGHGLKKIQLHAENNEVEKIADLVDEVLNDLNKALVYLTNFAE